MLPSLFLHMLFSRRRALKTNRQPINRIPIATREEMERASIETLDFVYVLGDAYIDHPSFGAAIISRILQENGFSIGIICQPDWHNVDDFRRLDRPRLGFLVSSGNIDSMVNHYTAAKRPRSEDAYSEAGKSGMRPDRGNISDVLHLLVKYPVFLCNVMSIGACVGVASFDLECGRIILHLHHDAYHQA